jgi:hypothetical protein
MRLWSRLTSNRKGKNLILGKDSFSTAQKIEPVPLPCEPQRKIQEAIMKLFKMLAGAVLFLAVLCVLAVPGASAESANQLPATFSSLSIFVTLGLLCLVIGLGLRAFSKPPTDLSINQPKK